jgi:indole-3-glycerol phosphate synthase
MNILEKIYQDKIIEVRNCKKALPLTQICALMKESPRKPKGFVKSIEDKLANKKTAIICEVKKASPSKGIIREDFDPVQIAKIYESNGAACISVLTDEKYFMGKSEYLSAVRKEVNLPILRKDFIVDAYQIYEAKLIGADCILLIMAMIDLETAMEFEKIANDIGLDVLAEVHDKEELDLALKLKTKLIGINNRNLKTLKVDINTSKELEKFIPKDKIVVCESGISTKDDIITMQESKINTFLIGESLMRCDDIGQALQKLL